jgi:LysM repeat protein
VFGRILIAAALVALVVATIARTSSGAGHERVYVVRPGDTLWTIAARSYAGDPREGVWRIGRRNHLDDTLIRPGERLVLP